MENLEPSSTTGKMQNTADSSEEILWVSQNLKQLSNDEAIHSSVHKWEMKANCLNFCTLMHAVVWLRNEFEHRLMYLYTVPSSWCYLGEVIELAGVSMSFGVALRVVPLPVFYLCFLFLQPCLFAAIPFPWLKTLWVWNCKPKYTCRYPACLTTSR